MVRSIRMIGAAIVLGATALGVTALGATGASAHGLGGFHGGGFHLGGWGGGWAHVAGLRIGFRPVLGGCYIKQYVDIYGDIVAKRICY